MNGVVGVDKNAVTVFIVNPGRGINRSFVFFPACCNFHTHLDGLHCVGWIKIRHISHIACATVEIVFSHGSGQIQGHLAHKAIGFIQQLKRFLINRGRLSSTCFRHTKPFFNIVVHETQIDKRKDNIIQRIVLDLPQFLDEDP